MMLRPGIGYPLTSSYLQFNRFLAVMLMPKAVDPFSVNLLDIAMSNVFQSARLPAESFLPVFQIQRGFKVYPFHSAFKSAVTVCFAIYAICWP